MSPSRKPNVAELHRSNRSAWNEGAQAYENNLQSTIAFLKEGGVNLDPPELLYLKDLSQWCKRAIHLQCAGGRDTLSLWNHGAEEVVGLDISDRMIETARATSEAVGARALWYRCDVLEAPHELDSTADLVYTGRGALYWLMDISAWEKVVERLLKPQGRLYIFEGHPLDWVWNEDAPTYQIDSNPPLGDYFSQSINEGTGWSETYIPAKAVIPKDKQSRKYERQWTLGQIINSLIDAGLSMVRFEEHPGTFWNQFPNMPSDTCRRLPHTFSLLMQKKSCSNTL